VTSARIRASTLLSGVLLVATAAAQDDPPVVEGPALGGIEIPGTRVRLDMPLDFEVARSFAGLVHHLTGTTVVVRELDVGLEQLSLWLERDALEARGLRRRGAERLEANGREGLVVHATEDRDYMDLRHWLGVFGEGQRSVLIVATVQDAFDSHLHDTVMRVLASTLWDPSQPLEPKEELSFRLPQTRHLAYTPQLSEQLVLLPRDHLGPLAGNAPHAFARRYELASEVDDLERFALEHLAGSDQTSTLEDVNGHKLQHDGLPAHEIVAKGSDFEHLTPLVLYQLLILDEGRFFAIQGFAPLEDRELWVPRFRELARGFQRVR
jgi:hypothetical protein